DLGRHHKDDREDVQGKDKPKHDGSMDRIYGDGVRRRFGYDVRHQRTASSAPTASAPRVDLSTNSPIIELRSQNVLQILRGYIVPYATFEGAIYSTPKPLFVSGDK
ncbi:MAG: hypothetical protein ACRD9W_26585, partial [Terriglobia bacterium]